ncbi:MAG: pectinesterase family protein [Salinivirgaceae bacterium]|nr:pectinesterase family protein [Salinivirgaceae bacterium]
MRCHLITFIRLLFVVFPIAADGSSNPIQVAKDGSGDFTTIQRAIESLPMYCYERVVIFVKKGVYNEKIRIDRDYITLVGESRENTRIEYNQLRDDWNKNPDAIGPAVVNIFADDVILKNLTIENTQPEVVPHAFAIYGTGTRTILKNCTVTSKGGDTVSLWNYKQGMYYHDSCYFEGAVDFVCPRGWCYISNSTFFEHKNTAAVWHAAPVNPNQKMVLYNCDFQGADSFYLARHHYDAQFYFIDCRFPALMRNKSIEHVFDQEHPEKNRPYLYGDRYYFYHCSRSAGNYAWFADNTQIWPKNTTPQTVTPEWTFDGNWNPETKELLEVKKITCEKGSLFLYFDALVMPVGKLVIKSQSDVLFTYLTGVGRDRLEFTSSEIFPTDDLSKPFIIVSGQIQNISATLEPQKIPTVFTVSETNY